MGYCSDGFEQYNDFCYKVLEDAKPWNESRADCQAFGHDFNLVSVHDMKENSFVASLLDKNRIKSANGVWTGGIMTVSQTVLSWSDNTNVEVDNWGEGQPVLLAPVSISKLANWVYKFATSGGKPVCCYV